jgi:hypothetical protein
MRSPPGKRQRGVHEQGRDLEGHGADPDGERHRQAPDEGQPRVLPQHPEPEPDVEREAAEPGQTASIAQRLPVLRDATEGDDGAATGLVMRQALLADETAGFHLDVKADLLVRTRLRGSPREEQMQARSGS